MICFPPALKEDDPEAASVVTRNYSEKSINGILDYVGDGGKKGKGRKVAAVAATQGVDVEVLQKFYEVTKASLEDTKNDVSTSDIPPPRLTTAVWNRDCL